MVRQQAQVVSRSVRRSAQAGGAGEVLAQDRSDDAPDAADAWATRLARICGDPSLVQVALQPIVDLSRGTVAGFEALARLPGPGGPEPWFAAAAAHGRADAFEAAVLGRTLAARADLPPNTFLSVNLSPAAMLGPAVQRVLHRADALSGVVVEITEQSAVADYAELVGAVERVRERGGLVAVDDMGAGHASLSHVLKLRPDFVKLDRDLVADCDRDEARLAVLEMLGDFAGRIDAWVVAEGIERRAELEAVARIGLPLAQGYHLGRPGPSVSALAPELARKLARGAAGREPGADLRGVVEPAVVVDARDAEAIRSALAEPDAPPVLVLSEGGSRPAALLVASARERVAVTTTGATDLAADVARRAMARPLSRRFDPVVVCDDLGRTIGMVRMERLVCHLADA